MDAAKNGKGRLTLKSIFSKMAQKWPKNCIFSNFPLTFLMVIGDVHPSYYPVTWTYIEKPSYYLIVGNIKSEWNELREF